MSVISVEEIKVLTQVTRDLNAPQMLEQLLQLIADAAAQLLQTQRASIRLLEASGSRLMSVVRAGTPHHTDASRAFTMGEGLVGWVAHQMEPLVVADAPEDPRYLARPDMTVPLRGFVGVPLMAGTTCLGVLSATHEQAGHFTARHLQLLELLAGICAPHVELARLSRLSQVDPLTGALNRRGLDMMFPELPPHEAGPLAVVMADVDLFKRVNDRYGHALGDEALRRVSHLFGGVLRRGDAVVRYGGEEFLLVLPGLEMARALRVAERARAAVQETPLLMGDVEVPLTVSMGVAARREGETREGLISRADAALYRAKEAGRNRVVAAR